MIFRELKPQITLDGGECWTAENPAPADNLFDFLSKIHPCAQVAWDRDFDFDDESINDNIIARQWVNLKDGFGACTFYHEQTYERCTWILLRDEKNPIGVRWVPRQMYREIVEDRDRLRRPSLLNHPLTIREE